ncbi:MAG: epoxyqueuosine reductase QueH [Alphaproteobacteria bacterium]|nr:epoxyqueuosine reductase QueH [Alphaproteobacteria bacterium]
MSDMRLVLLSCCAPCSSGAIKQLAEHGIDGVSDFIVLFYNPNIFPETEYTKRMNEQIKYCEQCGVKYAVLEYNHDAWLDAVRGHENAPERGPRCSLCFEYRFKRAVKFAQENGYNAIASVLGVSRHKSQNQVDCAAQNVCENIKYLPVKWDEDLRLQINRESDFYRQNYCGCEFSIRKV